MSVSLADQFSIINNIFTNTIEQTQNNINTPNITKQLYPHQKNMVNAMNLHYLRMTHGYIYNNQLLHGKLGIVADPPGTGKSLSILSFISMLKNTQSNQPNNILRQGDLDENSNRYFYSNYLTSTTDVSSSHLIIVPQHLMAQWKQEIEVSTNLNFFMVENRRILRNRTTPSLMCQADIVLITNKVYRHVHDFAVNNNIRWKHVFIDDASSIHFTSSDPKLVFEFLWLITPNWLNLMFKNTWISPNDILYIRDRNQIHNDCYDWLTKMNSTATTISSSIVSSAFLKQYIPFGHNARHIMVLLNSKKNLTESYNIPQPVLNSIECRINYTLTSLSQMPSTLNSPKKIPDVYESLGVRQYDISGIITDYPEKSALIQRKIEDDCCSICLDSVQNRTLATCCMNAFCGGCILRNLIISNSCPTCRKVINTDDLAFIPTQSDNDISGQNMLFNRHDTCINYIKTHANEPILIYTVFENTFYQLLPDIQRLGIEVGRLENTTINRTLDDFESGRIKVLFASNIDLIRGLNLTKLKHLLFFYELAFSEQRELLISSGQRLGRVDPLHIVQLRYQQTEGGAEGQE